LLRLYERTGDRELWDAAQEGLAYERSVYAPRHENWPDFRWPQQRFAMAWCHGAPGIGLARAAALPVSDDAHTRQEIAVAFEQTARVARGLAPVDHLCCGNAGLLDILLCGARTLRDPALLGQAGDLAARLVARAAGGGQFRLLSGGDDFFVASLFQGAAGVGYALLRLAAPETLPSVLLIE
jgi:lantibiotic modifying enzyme